MPDSSFREEVLNVELARILQKQGLVSYPETRQQTAAGKTALPDVLVIYQGLRTIIEGKIEDQPDSQENVHRQAYKRVTDGLAHIAIAVLYPSTLRRAPTAYSKSLYSSNLQFEVITEFGSQGWSSAKASDLGDVLRRTFEHLSKQDLVYETARDIEVTVTEFSALMLSHAGPIEGLGRVLGMKEPPIDEKEKRSEVFRHKWSEGITKIAGLTLLNAMIFYEMVRENKGMAGLPPLRNMLEISDPIGNLINAWTTITREIDYQPIFGIGVQLLYYLPSSRDSVIALNKLGNRAFEVLLKNTSMKHDLMGRVYHTLLADKKYLGTYYTSVPSATMLLKVALADKWDMMDWADSEQLGNFRAADLACGTGTLLMATYEALTDNHIHASYQQGILPDLTQTHPLIMEKILYGYDVLPSALHLTASTLALRSSSIHFDRMNLYSLPLGGKGARLGSIEYLQGNQIWMDVDVFESALQVTGEGSASHPEAPLPMLDLCVINPPFTRSVGGNLLFGSSPDQERKVMQQKLSKLLSKKDSSGRPLIMANATAGLGSVFIAIADKFLKVGGKLALVIPKTLLSGVSWEKTRQLLAAKYVVETIIASHDPDAWNFSDNTDLSEVLLVARKVGNGNSLPEKREARVKFVNLRKNPKTVFAALMTARQIMAEDATDIETGQGAEEIEIDGEECGEIVSTPWIEIKDKNWIIPLAFAQNTLVRFATFLQKGVFRSDALLKDIILSLSPLGQLGSLGPDRNGIHSAFSISKTKTAFPAYWGHDAKQCVNLSQAVNKYMKPKAKSAKDTKAQRLIKRAGNIMIAERLRTNTQSVCAFRIESEALSNVWWPFKVSLGENAQKALIIWLNSTLGLVLFIGNRCETEGAWMDFKQGNLENLPVLDVSALSETQLNTLAGTFDEVADQPLLPFPQMEHDPVRAKIDAAVSKALGLPDLTPYRMLLGQEPVVCLKRLGE